MSQSIWLRDSLAANLDVYDKFPSYVLQILDWSTGSCKLCTQTEIMKIQSVRKGEMLHQNEVRISHIEGLPLNTFVTYSPFFNISYSEQQKKKKKKKKQEVSQVSLPFRLRN
jgi:hypothetical protein